LVYDFVSGNNGDLNALFLLTLGDTFHEWLREAFAAPLATAVFSQAARQPVD